jgi:hypothetical protein
LRGLNPIDQENLFERIKTGGKLSKKEKVTIAAMQVIFQYKTMKLTVRQIFYRLVATQKFSNTVANYHLLVNTLSWARRGLLIDYDSIEDRTREVTEADKNEVAPADHFKTHFDYLKNAQDYYSVPLWWHQETRVVVMLEKQALASVFERVTKPLEVDLVVCRGYPSLSLLYELSERLKEETKNIQILYFGDYDPSGIDIQRSLNQTLNEDFWMTFEIERVAITREQIDTLHIPPAPAKKTDSRTRRFEEREGVSWQVELDAIEPNALSELIETNIMNYMDMSIREQRDQLNGLRLRRIKAAITNAINPAFNLEETIKIFEDDEGIE